MSIDQERDQAIERAMAATKAAIPIADGDPDRPAFHFHAPAQWLNDPNGPLFWNGWYHVFYQAHPFGAQSGPKYWGHARSRDMVDWEQLPIALWPSTSKCENEIWSGSCFPGPQGPMAFYTSISDRRPPEQWAAVAEDPDLIHWQKLPSEPVLTSDLQEWRDPYLFENDRHTFLITGGGERDRGIVALYRAQDASLEHWSYQGILFHHPDPDVRNIECPNFSRIGSKWLLLVSAHGRVEYFLGDLDSSMQFRSESRGVLDEGSYASQLFTDDRGRRIHLAWVPTNDHVGWNGFLTLPSVLSLSKAGELVREPLPELRKLRVGTIRVPDRTVEGEADVSSKASGDLLEIEASVEPAGAKRFGFRLRRSKDGSRSVEVGYDARPGSRKVHLFLDRGVVDDCDGAGRTIRFSARPEDLGLSLFTEGGRVAFRNLRVYRLRPARFDLSRFK